MSKRKLPERQNSLYKKKQRMESTAYDELSELEKLPLEILENIIGNLRGRDILQLSTCSKYLYSTIAESSRLLQGIKFRMLTKAQLENNFLSNEWNSELGKRKYSSIIFRGQCFKYNDDLTKALAPLKNFKSSVKTIEFDFSRNHGLTRTLINKVLSMCSNVEELKVNSVYRQIRYDDDWFFHQDFFSEYNFRDYELSSGIVESEYNKGPKPLKKLQHLKVLHFGGVYSMLDCFKDCSLQKLIIDETKGEEYTTLHKIRLQRFLQTQPELKSLHFVNLGDRILRDDMMSNSMPFKLKELIIDYLHLYHREVELSFPYFRSFLETHKDTLETFVMIDRLHPSLPILEILSNFPKLKKLDIQIGEFFSEFPLMKQVEHLLIELDDVEIPKFDDKFPNVKKLEFVDLLVKNFTDETLQEMKKLDSIVFKRCGFIDRLSISVKKVIIEDLSIFGTIELNDISELTISHCSWNCEWIEPLLQKSAGKLKYLKLDKVLLPAVMRTFLNSDHKIQTVICNKLSFE